MMSSARAEGAGLVPVRCRDRLPPMQDQPGPVQVLPIDAYTAPAWFEREQRDLFGRCWGFAGMTEDIPQPGDYACVDVGRVALFLLRDHDGRIRAFHNFCRHRGVRLLNGRGNLGRTISCFYHRWTYDLAGKLVSATLQREQLPDLDRARYGLKPAQLGFWRNAVFVNPDPEAEPFEAWLQQTLDRRDLNEPGQTGLHDPERLVQVSDLRYRVRANWKIVVENFIDGYHLPLLHRVSLADGDFMKQKWRPNGAHIMFYRPLKPGVTYDKELLPPVDGIPPTFGLAYYWLFPNVGIVETAMTWGTFHVLPIAADESIVHYRVRATPEGKARAEAASGTLDKLHAPFIGVEGPLGIIRAKEAQGDPLTANNVTLEDVYACEAVQRGFESGAGVGPLARWEATLTFFQQHVQRCIAEKPAKPLLREASD